MTEFFTGMAAYRRPATKRVGRVGMNYLSDLIVRPGIEKKLGPLLLYRGAMNRGHAHRLWNAALMMFAAECETLADGIKVINNPEFSQLCGPLRIPPKTTLWTYFSRLHDNPSVTANIDGFTDYVRSMNLGECILTRVDRFSDKHTCAEWRTSTHENAGQLYADRERGIPQSQQLFYPFIAHNHKLRDDEALVMLVNNAVPRGWPEHVRADVCQNMVVAMLSGDLTPGETHDYARKFITEHFKEYPMLWKDGKVLVAFDAPVPGTTGSGGGQLWTDRV